MKRITLLGICILIALFGIAQKTRILVAEKNDTEKKFRANERIKIRFNDQGSNIVVAGRIHFVTADTLFIHGLHRRTENRITAIPIKDIEKIKNFYTGARSTTGIIAMLGTLTGIAMLADGLSAQPVFFGDLPAAAGMGAIVAGLVPYTIVTMSEPTYKTKRGFRFSTIAMK
ncbi:MAG: hypothetical protein RL596_1426 [Bacteroidota bacterium]